MRYAIPVHENDVANVLDYARRLRLVDLDGQLLKANREVDIVAELLAGKASFLENLGVDVVVCGAVSRPLGRMIFHSGIEIIPNVSGDIDEVVNALVLGCLERFLSTGWSPGRGCRRGHGAQRRFRGR